MYHWIAQGLQFANLFFLSPHPDMDEKSVLDRLGDEIGWFVDQPYLLLLLLLLLLGSSLSGHYLDGSTSGSEMLRGKLHSVNFCDQKLGHGVCLVGSLHYIYHIYNIYHQISQIPRRIFTEDEGHLESTRVLRDWFSCPTRAPPGGFPMSEDQKVETSRTFSLSVVSWRPDAPRLQSARACARLRTGAVDPCGDLGVHCQHRGWPGDGWGNDRKCWHWHNMAQSLVDQGDIREFILQFCIWCFLLILKS